MGLCGLDRGVRKLLHLYTPPSVVDQAVGTLIAALQAALQHIVGGEGGILFRTSWLLFLFAREFERPWATGHWTMCVLGELYASPGVLGGDP